MNEKEISQDELIKKVKEELKNMKFIELINLKLSIDKAIKDFLINKVNKNE